MDVRQRQLREVGDDLIGALPSKFVPDIDILNADPRAGDTGFAATNARLLLDMLRYDRFHQDSPFHFKPYCSTAPRPAASAAIGQGVGVAANGPSQQRFSVALTSLPATI